MESDKPTLDKEKGDAANEAASSCDVDAPGLTLLESARSAYDAAKFSWQGAADEPYKSDSAASWEGIRRVTLLGPRQHGMDFHVRYFEVAPGGHSSREKHEHEHVVIGWRGQGIVEFDGREEPVKVGDIVYVAPQSVHQFRCAADAQVPFGFLCLVNAERDRPVLCPADDSPGSEGAES